MDPITFSIIRHRLFRVVEEAVITLKHVSGSAITNEGHDLMVSHGWRGIPSSPNKRSRSLQGDYPQVPRPNRRR
jgi:hypothetical protein